MKLSQLRSLIKQEVRRTMNESRTRRPTRRFGRRLRESFGEDEHMTSDEAREKCQEMNLDPTVTRFIVKQFVETENGNYTPQVGDNGRLAWGQSWQDVYQQLAVAMGQDEYEENEMIDEVFDVFFEE